MRCSCRKPRSARTRLENSSTSSEPVIPRSSAWSSWARLTASSWWWIKVSRKVSRSSRAISRNWVRVPPYSRNQRLVSPARETFSTARKRFAQGLNWGTLSRRHFSVRATAWRRNRVLRGAGCNPRPPHLLRDATPEFRSRRLSCRIKVPPYWRSLALAGNSTRRRGSGGLMDERAISFGSFRLLPSQRLLLEGDQPVRLGSRALDILAVLAENAGRVVPKEELIARVWPKVFVEESNLKIQVSALRRALGDGQGGNRYIVTVPGHGYEFIVPVGLTAEPAAMPVPAIPGTHNLPLATTRMIGREEAVARLVSRLSRERLLTIVGPGGIGKTTIALAVAERMIADYEHGVWLVDLAPLGDPRLVPSAVATVLGLEVRTENPLPGLIAALRDKRMLLLLDNCEHIIDAAASLAAAVLTGVPRVNILATSREPLAVAGEREHRLGPLGSPPNSSGLTAAEAAAFPAVQLFVERVTAIVENFALTDANAPLVSEICQRLDGLPLAIEFAAPRVEVLGVEGLAAGLNHSLPLLTARRRTAMPRHRTMRTVVDWSYGLLSEDEQQFFRALGIFAGGFTVEAAAAVTFDAADPPSDAIDQLADLVAKSLVVADVSGAKPRFRLLDTTSAYAIEKLNDTGERELISRRHAEHYRDVFERAAGEATAHT